MWTSGGVGVRWSEQLSDAGAPRATQRCHLRGGSRDGQVRLVAAGPTPRLTVPHQSVGRWWNETYAHDGVVPEVPTPGSVPDLPFRQRRSVAPTRPRFERPGVPVAESEPGPSGVRTGSQHAKPARKLRPSPPGGARGGLLQNWSERQ
jgi:hypothetical protein